MAVKTKDRCFMKSLHLHGDLARAFRTALVFAFILMSSLVVSVMFFVEQANAQAAKGPQIFDVRRSLPLESDEDVVKDFYINVGPESGLKKGVYVSVVRELPIHNPIQNKQQAELLVPVGKLKVIDVQRGITVARLESELSDDERPTLEFEGVMVGDYIDLGTISTDVPKKPKPKLKKSIAQVPSETPSAPDGEAGAGSAEAMAARSAAPAPASVAPISMTTTANVQTDLKPDLRTDAKSDAKTEITPTPPSSATNNSATPPTQSEEAAKKQQTPKSADRDEMNLDHPVKKGFPARPAADTVRVADYTDAGF
jgi:hypothetical protein